MTNKEAFEILTNKRGWTLEDRMQAEMIMTSEVEKLKRYRELFERITSQEDKTLSYSTYELEHYYKEIEDDNF